MKITMKITRWNPWHLQQRLLLKAQQFYKVHPSAKRYTLKDNGFTETKSGNFQLIRSLDPTPQRNEGFKLKITITADLKELKMSITTANGLKPMNIFKNEQHEMSKENTFS